MLIHFRAPKKNCSCRVCKKGARDVVFKDLSFSDAGTYILHVYYHNDQTELERQIRTYQLHIHDEISVKTVQEVWSRSSGAQSDQLTDTDGSLTIKEFTANDAGTYRALDHEGEILITVTVAECSTESKDKLDDTDTHKTELRTVWVWVLIVGLTVFVVLALMIHTRLNRRVLY
ncbi:hypothetical protein G5714_019113 [Onychostoma macrolepis]|uniref:Uncharacterized protein n=1 Tax=Onychostoma macrolepis TaxID=369639 RepID=A0A7J6C0Z4_9TELE|nr:hypothetical protein G5714_019113 [Onychostoma macrolepis]